MARCRICSEPAVREWLDFGPQALTNRFLTSRTEREFTHPCKIGACRHCGTVQLESPVPVDEMRPRFDWIRYNEPESHLDAVADAIAELPGLSPTSTIGGITYKDESTLTRLNARGFHTVEAENGREAVTRMRSFPGWSRHFSKNRGGCCI